MVVEAKDELIVELKALLAGARRPYWRGCSDDTAGNAMDLIAAPLTHFFLVRSTAGRRSSPPDEVTSEPAARAIVALLLGRTSIGSITCLAWSMSWPAAPAYAQLVTNVREQIKRALVAVRKARKP